eukprot:scaffold18928_cov69-Phaeocystis_antarctica.AAC.8
MAPRLRAISVAFHGDSRTGGNPLLDHVPQHTVGCELGARQRLVGLVGRVAPLRIRPARDRLKIIGRAVWRYSWLAHEAKRQRADELSRSAVVADEVIERLGDNEGRRPVLGPTSLEGSKLRGNIDQGSRVPGC